MAFDARPAFVARLRVPRPGLLRLQFLAELGRDVAVAALARVGLEHAFPHV